MSDSEDQKTIRMLRSQLAATEQLLAVHEETVRKQSDRLEEALQGLRSKQEELLGQNRIMMNREERILELKQEINALLQELGRPARFTL